MEGEIHTRHTCFFRYYLSLWCVVFALIGTPLPSEASEITPWWGKSQKEQSREKEKALAFALRELSSDNYELQEKSMYLLELMGAEAAPHLVDIIDDSSSNHDRKLHAIYAAGRLGHHGAPAVRSIIKELRSSDPDTRAAAASALGKIGKRANYAVPALKTLLTDESPWVRENAELALKRIGTHEARHALKTLEEQKASNGS